MSIKIETYGCAVNQADSEYLAGILQEHGHEISDDGEIVVVNTCTVKAPTENRIMKRLRELGNKKTIVAGCLPPVRPDIQKQFPKFSFIGTNVDDIATAVSSVSRNERFIRIDNPKDKVCIPRVRKNTVVEILPIAEGCVGGCAYCETKFARGKLHSYPKNLLIKQIMGAVSEGVKEVWITAQDTGAYGLDNSSSLPDLLRHIVKIPGDFKVRVGMMNPNHVLGFIDDLLGIFSNDKIYKFLHLPVQSGDDKVLKDMGRHYTASDFEHIVKRFGKAGTTISTDVIAGYPTETEEAFENTIRLLEKTKPDIVNISRFWSRPGTKAEKLKHLPGRETKRRSRIIDKLFREIGKGQNEKWLGWYGEALVSEKNDDGSFTARNFAYRPIILKSKEDLMGKTVRVEVTDCTYYDLRGEVVG